MSIKFNTCTSTYTFFFLLSLVSIVNGGFLSIIRQQHQQKTSLAANVLADPKVPQVPVSRELNFNTEIGIPLSLQLTYQLKANAIEIDWSHFQSFIETLDLSNGLDGEYRNIKYLNSFSRGVGKLEAHGLIIDIVDGKVNVIYKSITIVQEIPILYTQQENCKKTGGRRFIVAGPREKECTYPYVERGLYQHEIDFINARLLSALAANNKMLD